MHKGGGSRRRAIRAGVFLVAFVLALSLTSIALAHSATFTNPRPAPGSTTGVTMPTIRVTVYDYYGSYGKDTKMMWIDGVRVYPRATYWSGYSNYQKFTLSYKVPAPLAYGTREMKVLVRDRKGNVHRYYWDFKVADRVPPTTTSDALLNYDGAATIHLSATDNVGVAATYYSLDGGPIVADTHLTVPAAEVAQLHFLEFWSVDVNGNVELSKVELFLVTPIVEPEEPFVHPKPVSTCTQAGCHAGVDVATIHGETGCYYCHAGDEPAIANCNDAGCHGTTPPAGHDPDTHAKIPSAPEVPAEDCTQAGCHGDAGALAIHANCAVCHNSGIQAIDDIIAAGDATCESCHTDSIEVIHDSGTAHLVEGQCFGSDCHVNGDVAFIHSSGPGCTACHAEGVTPTTDCSACHQMPPSGHGSDDHAVVPAAGQPDCTTSACHGGAVVTTHGGNCDLCHDSTSQVVQDAVASGNATCDSCHPAGSYHPGAAAAHTVQGPCYGSTCHGDNDVAFIHSVGVGPPWCVACHAEGVTPSTDCDVCHSAESQTAAHDYVHDASGAPPGPEGPSSACVSCHGSNFESVLVPSDPPTTAHNQGCFCHTRSYLQEDMQLDNGCANCHKEMYAPHGFKEEASGHSTTTYGTRGMREYYDGSDDGVVVSDTLGNPIEGEWAVPSARVFWDPADPNKPADAMVVNQHSVITCEDCHAGLVGLVGPQGANAANVGIDPNYPQPYKNAVLSYYQTAAGTSTAGVPYTRLPAKSGINYRTSWETTDTADLRIGDEDVICAKCHDLWEENAAGTASADASAAAFFGFGNFPHEEHSRNNASGRGDCVNCHAAIPHGWKRPRLLIQTYSGEVTYTAGTTDTVVGDAYPYANPRGYWQVDAPNGGWGSKLPEFKGAIAGLGLLPAVWGDNADTLRGYVPGGPGDHPPVVIPQIGEMKSSFIAPEWQERSQDCQAGCGGSATRHAITVHRAFIE